MGSVLNWKIGPNTRWGSAARPYTKEDVQRLQGTVKIEYTMASLGAARLRQLLQEEEFVPALGALTGFAEGVHQHHPGKLMAYNCSPSFNWRKKLDDSTIARFQRELAAMGYKFQFITLAGFHALNYSMFSLARGFKERGMSAYAELQEAEFAAETLGYTATRHQREVGTGYFDEVSVIISGGESSTTALHGSTESEQFNQ
jgi:isocitrate lyase